MTEDSLTISFAGKLTTFLAVGISIQNPYPVCSSSLSDTYRTAMSKTLPYRHIHFPNLVRSGCLPES